MAEQRDVIEVLEHDHREVEEMFAELESLRGATSEEDKERRKAVTEQVTIELVRHSVAEEVASLMREIRHHIEDEEGEMFAHMRQVIDQDELRQLGARVEAFKKVAPTRPHPSVPNTPLARIAAGPGASLFDRMRDLATGRGTDD